MQLHNFGLIVLICTGLIVVDTTALPTPEQWKESTLNQFSRLTREEVDAFIDPLITYNLSKGVVVVLVDRNGYTWYSYGVKDAISKEFPDNTTLFEIGSISKVMTGHLMIDAQHRGLFNISEPINTWLPDQYRITDEEGSRITGIDLVTHRSGLPRVPDTFAETNSALSSEDTIEESMQHFRTMNAAAVYEWVRNQSLMTPPGYEYSYSNLGGAIAGDIVSRATGISYPELLTEQILIPLGMMNSGAEWTSESLNKRTTGYRGYAYPMDESHLIRFNDFWSATGGVHSNADDMALYLAAQLDLIETPLADSIKETHLPLSISSAGPPMLEQGVFWDILHNRDGTIIIKKAGETNSHQASIAFNPKLQAGVVILSNTASISGMHVEEESIALLERIQVKETYAGKG